MRGKLRADSDRKLRQRTVMTEERERKQKNYFQT